MSLWTPDGEHEVPRERAAAPPDEPPAGQMPGAPDLDDLTPEEQARAQEIAAEMAEARARIAETPAAVVIANHAMGLYELGAIHLTQDPPNKEEARVAIDAMSAILTACSGRLGEGEATLAQALQQIQMVFVEIGQPDQA